MNLLLEIAWLNSSAIVERLGWTLVHSLWQFSAVALLAAVTVRAMRRNSAAVRYGVLVVAMVISVAIPVATWLLEPTIASALSLGRATSDPGHLDPSDNSLTHPTRRADRATLAGDPSSDPLPSDITSPATAAHSRSDHDSRDAQLTRWSRMQSALRPWFAWMVAGWSLGVLVCSLRPLLGWRTLRRLRRVGVSPASDEILAAMRRVSQQLGLRRTVQVLRSALTQVPVVVGYLQPVVLLPVSLVTSIPARQLEAILAHELAHVRRHDFAVNFLQTLVETIFFYHPAVWWLSRRIRVEREHCCDDLAVSLLGNRAEYGRALLAIEELRGQSAILALGAAGGSLLSRVRRIVGATSGNCAASWVDRWPAAILCLALVGATCLATINRKVAAKDDARRTATNEANAIGDARANEAAANGEIVGRLTDAVTGRPVEGATIACGALINDSGKGGGVNAVTDAEGRYRLLVPSPGIYNVWLKKFDKERSKTAAADDGIRVEAGKISASQLRLVVGRKVAGKVVDFAGKTFGNMEVYCYSSAQPPSGGPQSVRTKADGSFEFALPPGRGHIYVVEQDQKHPDGPFAVSRSADAYIQVPADGDIPPLTLTLEASQSRFGDPQWLKRSTPGTQIVRHEGNKDVTGTVVGEDGKLVAGARVFPEDGTPVLTNDKGEFRVETLRGTQLVMHAVATGYHAWFGAPTSGDVLKIVLEPKPLPAAGQDALPPAPNPPSRTFAVRFKLASETADDLRQILLGRPGNEAKPSADNQRITVTAPAEVINRAQTFINVTDWPDNITRGSNFEYPRETVMRAARSFFYACAIEDADEVFSKLLSLRVLAELKGDTKSRQYETYLTGGLPDPEWEKRLRADWPGRNQAIQRLVREWNRYPLKRITERNGVAIGFGAKYFCSVSFDGAPKDSYEVTIEPDRSGRGGGKDSFHFSSLPPWWKDAEKKVLAEQVARAEAARKTTEKAVRYLNSSHPHDTPAAVDPKQAAADETAFHDAAKINAQSHTIEFVRPPTAGVLRHLERLQGDWTVAVQWPGSMDKSAAVAFQGAHIKSVSAIELAEPGTIDAWLRELARPDTGLKSLTSLDLRGTQITDADLKELTRPDSGLKTLASLHLRGTNLTEAGLKELARPDSGLLALAELDLGETKMTDADLKEFARPDGGLKTLTSLDLYRTRITDAGLKELARPDSGLSALASLDLNGTQVTDAALKDIARTDTGLKALVLLDLIRTHVTDAGLKELARPDSGVKALASLDLYGTQVTDVGLKALARDDSPLKLTSLRLSGTRVTDVGLKELARPKSALKTLTSLDLSDTRVTDAGLKELARPDTGVPGLVTLSLWATQVTDVGLKELARPDSGLKTLGSLYLHHTKVTDASIEALQKARPGLRIER